MWVSAIIATMTCLVHEYSSFLSILQLGMRAPNSLRHASSTTTCKSSERTLPSTEFHRCCGPGAWGRLCSGFQCLLLQLWNVQLLTVWACVQLSFSCHPLVLHFSNGIFGNFMLKIKNIKLLFQLSNCLRRKSIFFFPVGNSFYQNYTY